MGALIGRMRAVVFDCIEHDWMLILRISLGQFNDGFYVNNLGDNLIAHCTQQISGTYKDAP